MFQASLTQSDAQKLIRSFLLTILPSGVKVIEGQDNRVPEPKSGNYVAMWPLRRPRIETNVREDGDVRFVGSIAGSVMTVTSVSLGQVVIGSSIFGVGVAAGTVVTSLGTGTGGVGTYNLSIPQTLSARTLSSGAIRVTQATELVMQFDVHGPDSAQNVQVISTLVRDAYSVEWFAGLSPDLAPLFVDDPVQLPFVNAEGQTENRWTVDAHFQANITVEAPQQYADVVRVDLIDVDAVYPP